MTVLKTEQNGRTLRCSVTFAANFAANDRAGTNLLPDTVRYAAERLLRKNQPLAHMLVPLSYRLRFAKGKAARQGQHLTLQAPGRYFDTHADVYLDLTVTAAGIEINAVHLLAPASTYRSRWPLVTLA